MTRIDVHEAISRLDIIPKFKIYTFCLLSGIKLEELEEIHRKMETLLGEKGAYLDSIY